jgi:hypothetical protein
VNWVGALRGPEFAAYVATTALALIPVWLPSIFPSQDGGAHLYNAHVLAALLSGDDAAQYRAVYELNFTALANWTDHLLLAVFDMLVRPAIAEKLLVSAYVIGFAAAARYAAESVREGHGWVAHLALPLIFTFNVQMGFYNFILCFPLYFVLIGYYWRHREAQHTLPLAALLLLIYVLHPLPWLFGVLSLTIIVLAGTIGRRAPDGARPGLRGLLRVWGAAAPGAVLLLVLVSNEPVETTEWQPFSALLRHLYFAGPLWTFSPVDTAFGAALFGLFAGVTAVAWWSRSRGGRVPALAWLTLVYFALLVMLPSQWKSLGLITERVGTFAFLTWVLFLAGRCYGPRSRTSIIVAAQVLAILLIVRWTVAVESLDDYAEEYLSVAAHIAPATRLLELNFAPRGRGPTGERLSHPVAPFAHTIGVVGAARDAVILNDYEALTVVFPLKHRSDAAQLLESTLHDPPDFRMEDLAAFERATCQPIDYVVVWQPDRENPHTRLLLQSLAARYALMYVSEGGRVRLHARRGEAPCT